MPPLLCSTLFLIGVATGALIVIAVAACLMFTKGRKQ